jgi:hypothetical protein
MAPGWLTVHWTWVSIVKLGAAGSGGSIALCVDDGQHWQKRHKYPGEGKLLVLGFVIDKFGSAAGRGKHLLLTDDRGETRKDSIEVPAWGPVKPVSDARWQSKYPYTSLIS